MRDRLYRSRDDRVIFGVAGGVADGLDIDPTLVRIAFALAFLLGGSGLLIYIVMAIIVPEEPYMTQMPPTTGVPGAPAPTPDAGWTPPATGAPGTGSPTGSPAPGAPMSWMDERAARRAARRARRAERDGRGAVIFGSILVLIGGWFLAQRYIPALNSDLLGPVILIGIGVLLVAGAVGRSENHRDEPPR